MPLIEKLAKGLLYCMRLLIGFAVYLATKKTPTFAYYSMVGLFCLTRGRSNDLLSKLIGLVRRPYSFTRAEGILGDMAAKTVNEPIVAQLRSRGFYVFESCLPEKLCDSLLQYALSHPCKTRIMDGDKKPRSIEVIYPRDRPAAVRYDFETLQLLENEDVQKLLADLSFGALAQEYLGARPTIDVLAMWWHTAYSQIPDSEAAQYFHFDMDRPKWLKYFIYLTDVTTASGPHSFVAGSHRTGGIPDHLLRKGYSRLMDEEVTGVFKAEDIIEFTGARGTIIAEDTRGLHKGKHVETGDRLVLQIQFSNSLFGATHLSTRMDGHVSRELGEQAARFPGLYAAYLR
jgi:hypothetical protein